MKNKFKIGENLDNNAKKGLGLIMVAILFNLAESLYFGRGTELGFNLHAASAAELTCDYIAMILMIIGAVLCGVSIASSRKVINVHIYDCAKRAEECPAMPEEESACQKNSQSETQDIPKT